MQSNLQEAKKIQLLPKQREFIKSTARYPAYFGGVGNGKTMAGCLKSLLLAEAFPNNVGMILRQSFRQLQDSTMKSFWELRPDLKDHYSASEMKVYLPNGSEIWFRHADELVLGANLGFFYIDQAEQIEQAVFNSLTGRLRRDIPIRQGFITGNPAGHNWIWERWKVKHGVKEEDKKDYHLVEGQTGENTHLPPGYLDALMASWSDEEVQRYVYGSWEGWEGLVWPDFTPTDEFGKPKHVVKAFTPPRDWYHFRSIDYGFRNPFACLWMAEDQDGVVWVYNETYNKNWLLSENANAILEKSKGIDPYTGQEGERDWMTYIDPSCMNRTHEKNGQQVSIADELNDYGIPTIPANNDVSAGLSRVGEYFKQGRLKIMDNCPNLVWEIQQYVWKPVPDKSLHGRTPPEEPRKKDDHACFVRGTKVRTVDGDIPIEHLGLSDIVLTRNGPRPISAVAITGLTDVFDVNLSNGKKLTGTGNHPVWVDGRGFCPIDTLRYGDILLSCKSNSTDERMFSIEENDTFAAARDTYTEMFGRRSMDLYHQAGMSTISMATASTITLRTLSSSQAGIISPTTDESEGVLQRCWRILRESVRRLLHGTVPKKDSSFTVGTANVYGKDGKEPENPASNAGSPLPIGPNNSPVSSVILTAKQKTSEDVTVVSVIPAGISRVYNITVDDVHEYFANGVLVANCDALRYGIMSRTWHVPASRWNLQQDEHDMISSRGESGYGF